MAENPVASGSTTPRIVALILGLTFLSLIIAFVAMAMISRDEVRLNAVGPLGPAPGVERGGVRFTGTIHVWEVVGGIGHDAQGNAQLQLNLRGPTAQPPDASLPLSVALKRPDSEATLPIPLTRTGPGVYTGAAPLPGDGQWQLRLTVPEVTGVLNFTLDP